MSTDNHLPKDNSSVPGRTNDPETFAKFASVKSYQDYLADKDNPVVMVTLTVNDQGFLDNTTFETYLTQHTNAHDEFTIVVSDTAIDDFYGQVMRNSKNLLGEPITIHIHHKGAAEVMGTYISQAMDLASSWIVEKNANPMRIKPSLRSLQRPPMSMGM